MVAISSSAVYRALVVDDDATVRAAIANALTRVGLQCQLAADGQEALQALRTSRFDVVVTDIRMPQQNGHALAVDLLGRIERPLVIVLTGVLEPQLTRDLIARGVDDVCFKPVDCMAFATKARALLDRQRARQPEVPRSDSAAAIEAASRSEEVPAASMLGSHILAPPSDQRSTAARHLIAILLKNQAHAEELAGALTSGSALAIAAPGSEAFHELLNRERIDLVIIEQNLGGFLSGVEILQRLYKDLLRPDTILLAESGWDTDQAAEQLGIEKVLSPRSSLETLTDAARTVLASRRIATSFIPQPARRLVEQFESIPPLPQLLIKLLSYMDLDAQDVPIQELANEISVDPKATAALLSLTNSSSSGVRQKVSRVFDAINLLGVRRTISLVVASATMASQSELLKQWSEPLRNWYRQRSVLIASTAATFARRIENVSPDTAFVLGLLQDTGILVLGSSFEGRYAEITLRRAREIAHLQLCGVELEDYKLTHAEVSAALLQKWKLPQSLVGLVLDHHKQHTADDRSRIDQSFLRVMQIGEAVADLSDVTHPVRRQALNRLLAAYPENRAGECRQSITESVAAAVQSCQLFSVPLPDGDVLSDLAERIALCRESVAT